MMRFRFKAAGAVVAIAAFGAVSLAPRVVHANSSPLDVVAFSAPTTAGTLTPVKAVLNGTGGGGSYQFSSNNPSPLPVAGCFGVSVETASPEVAASCTIASPSGTYTNIVCGTGMAGDAGGTVTENASEGGSDVYSTPYSIVFVAGVGVITGSATDTSDGGSGPLAGVVDIVPTTGNCVTTDVSQFTAIGVAVTTA